MAYVVCDRHGGHVAPLLCTHLYEAVHLGRRVPEVFYVEAWYRGEPAWMHHLCGECARRGGVVESRTIWRDDESLDRLFAMNVNVVPICPKCFAAARQVV